MRLRELESFVAVAEELHFARAAARLNLAQQPLSQNIKKLEERLGVTLFERTTRRVRLSGAGEAYLPYARSALRLLSEGKEAGKQAARGESQRLLVGYVESALTLSASRVPALLQRFRQLHPACTLELRQGCSSELLAMLTNKELDAAFILAGTSWHGVRPLPDGLESCEVAQVPLSIAVSAHHPLAEAKALAWHELANQSFVGYANHRKSDLNVQFHDLCHQAGFIPRVIQEADSEGLMLSLVAAGIGLAVMPQDNLSRTDVVYVPLQQPEVNLVYNLAWVQKQENDAQRLLFSLIETQGMPTVL